MAKDRTLKMWMDEGSLIIEERLRMSNTGGGFRANWETERVALTPAEVQKLIALLGREAVRDGE